MENKKYESEIKDVDDDQRIIRILASDESVDRDGDIIKAKGWEFDNFIKTGSIIYGHDPSNLPLALPLSAEIVGKKLYINAQFAAEGTSEFNDAVYSLIKQKIVRGVSVGFLGKEWDEIDTGREFKKQELLELSVVPVPSNPNAKLLVKQYGEDTISKIFEEKEEEVKEEVEAKPDETNVELEEAKPDDDLANFLRLQNILEKL